MRVGKESCAGTCGRHPVHWREPSLEGSLTLGGPSFGGNPPVVGASFGTGEERRGGDLSGH
jgi:hypothetical protein